MNWIFIISLPIISALIGWVTNRLAIHMLFHPRMPKRFFGLKLQGLIPRRHQELADSAGEVVEQEILESHVIKAELKKMDLSDVMENFVKQMVYEGIGPRLKNIPLVGGFINDSTLGNLHNMALEEMEKNADPLIETIATKAEEKLDFRKITSERIASFEMERLEKVIHTIAKKEFKAIEVLGAVLGFIIGCVQVSIYVLTQQSF